MQRRFAPLLALILLAAAVLLYLPTLAASFVYDDMDHLNLIGDALAGKTGYWHTVFTPHLEHLVPLLVMAFHASVRLFGVEALPLRLLILLAHAAAAWFMGLVARRYGGTPTAGVAAGLAYLLPAGFSSMWVWQLNGSGVVLFLFGLTGAVAALAYRDRLGPLRAGVLAGGGILIAAASESTLVPLLLFPALLVEIERRRGGAPARRFLPGAFAAACLAAMAGTAALAISLFHRLYSGHLQLGFLHGMLRAVFLLMVAPFRYLCSGVTLARPSDPGFTTPVSGCLLGLVFAAAAAALLIALWQHCPRALLRVAACAAVGSILEIVLVGIGRAATTFPEIYDADRYFFTLLLPICLLAGTLAEAVRGAIEPWPRRRRRALLAVLAVGLAAECVLHRQALINRIPFGVFARHERRIAQLARLGDDLAAAARQLPPGAPPLALPDTSFWFPDVHNGRVSTRLLLYGIRHGIPGVRLGDPAVSPRDERLLNPVLTRWAAEIGEPTPYMSIAGGRLVNARMASVVDFRIDGQEAKVVSGFYDWEGSSRWMGGHGEVRIRLSCARLSFYVTAPVSLIRRHFPAMQATQVRVTAVDEASGRAAALGSFLLGGDGIDVQRIDATPLLRQVGAGRPTRLLLDAAPVWQPRAVLPGSADSRLMSIRLLAAGCGVQP
jgi:hypothetical protein